MTNWQKFIAGFNYLKAWAVRGEETPCSSIHTYTHTHCLELNFASFIHTVLRSSFWCCCCCCFCRGSSLDPYVPWAPHSSGPNWSPSLSPSLSLSGFPNNNGTKKKFFFHSSSSSSSSLHHHHLLLLLLLYVPHTHRIPKGLVFKRERWKSVSNNTYRKASSSSSSSSSSPFHPKKNIVCVCVWVVFGYRVLKRLATHLDNHKIINLYGIYCGQYVIFKLFWTMLV